MTSSFNLKAFLYSLFLLFFAFQRVLVEYSDIFSYVDELLGIYSCIYVFNTLIKTRKIEKSLLYILILWIIVICIGIFSNVKSGLLNNVSLIIIDLLSTVKVWFSYIFIYLIVKNECFCDNIIKISSSFIRLFTYIMFFFLILSQFIDLGMTSGVRYGVPSFHFIFNNPGNFSKFFYFLIPLLTADLYYKDNIYKRITIFLALIIWISTMRSRAFAFVLFFLVLFFLMLSKNIKFKIKKIKFKYLIYTGLIILPFCWDQLIFYFTNETQARSLLLRYGVITMINYFPFGSGFGTFGSDVAATSYSNLYNLYGFNNIYGMSPNHTYYLNDNYWPMTFGQFGIFGTICIISILAIFMINVLKKVKKNVYFYVGTITILVFLLFSSIASKSYSEFSSICIFMLLAIMTKKECLKNEAK